MPFLLSAPFSLPSPVAWHERISTTESVRYIRSSNPLVGLLAVLLVLLLAIPLIVLGIAAALIAVPVIACVRGYKRLTARAGRVGGRKNVRVIEPDDRIV